MENLESMFSKTPKTKPRNYFPKCFVGIFGIDSYRYLWGAIRMGAKRPGRAPPAHTTPHVVYILEK